jgi:hypothetical protein
MFIISGRSPKQQVLGEEQAPCRDCQQDTPHRVTRHYSVVHVFWFPLFSVNEQYVQTCTRCNLALVRVGFRPGPAVPPSPALHRFGLLFALGLFMLPCFICPAISGVLSLFGLKGAPPSASAGTPTQNFWNTFHAEQDDALAASTLERAMSQAGLSSFSVKGSSALAGGHRVRVLAAESARLKKVNDSDRLRLLALLEATADRAFPQDEVFLGLKGRLLWGGYSHREAGGAWERRVDEATSSPETKAMEALRRAPVPVVPSYVLAPDASTP